MSTLPAFAWADRDCERLVVAFEESDFAQIRQRLFCEFLWLCGFQLAGIAGHGQSPICS